MADTSHAWVCSVCGHIQERRTDLCNGCGEYQTVRKVKTEKAEDISKRKSEVVFTALKNAEPPPPMFSSGIGEVDRVLGGGLSQGATLFLSGPPGIGKSTLLLQMLALLASSGKKCVYISSEEAEGRLGQRAERLGVAGSPVHIAEATNTESTIAALREHGEIDVLVIDSIQQMSVRRFRSAPGTTTQVRASAQAFIRFARRSNIVLIMTGHITKDGKTAGPEQVIHMVDIPLRLDTDSYSGLHALRCEGKNRFGPSDEIGHFKMTNRGLAEATGGAMDT